MREKRNKYRWFSPTLFVLVLLLLLVSLMEIITPMESSSKDEYLFRIFSRLKEGKQVTGDEYFQLKIGLQGIPERDSFEKRNNLQKGEATQLLQAKYLIQLALPWSAITAEASVSSVTIESP